VTLGETFINLDYGPEHLWVVCSNHTAENAVVIFNFTGYRDGCDEACIILPGEHAFVTKKTHVAYSRGQLLPLRLLTVMKAKDAYRSHQSCTETLLRRIMQGALDSEQTPQHLQALVGEALAGLGAVLPISN